MSDPSSTESGKTNKFLQRAYELPNVDAARNLYNEWATTYDENLNAEDYASPQRAVEAVLANLRNDNSQLKILDAGCGTGLVGSCFAESELSGRFVLDGLDLSDRMLKVAEKTGAYRDLEVADLTLPINRGDASYDVVTCVGTLTKGHVGPEVLSEFARVTVPGGLIVGTVHDEIWESKGYKGEVDRLSKSEAIDTVSTDEFGILKSQSKGGRMMVLRKR